MADFTHILMQQAMKHGRTITISPADAIVNAPAGVAAPQFVQLKLTATSGVSRIVVAPTHATNGRQLQDKDWIHFVQQMASELDELER
ncbi:MAG TPA: hypothetical protein VGJ15_06245 [Pirellulales bacterium]|jgi:hypothetical protein